MSSAAASRNLASFLGLCQKAGKLAAGDTPCVSALRNKTAELIIICEDASDNTKKRFTQKAFHYNVPCRSALTADELGAAIGKGPRVVAAVMDAGFRDGILKILDTDSGPF